MDGIFGWLGETTVHFDVLKKMGRAARLSPEGVLYEHSSQMLGVAACSRFGKSSTHIESGLAATLQGRPVFLDDELAFIAHDQNPAAAAAHGWMRLREKLPTIMSGSFALAVLEPLKKQAFLAIDRVGTERLCYARPHGQLVFGASAQSVAAHPAIGRIIDPQAIYDYLYFHTIPSPRTLYQGIAKLQPGQFVHLDNDRFKQEFYWQADYRPAKSRSFEDARREFRSVLSHAVGDAARHPATAAFLSGGTDSSTIVGTLTEVRGDPVDTFSIGFDVKGFDEMEYARCAAERYRSRSHEYYLKPADIVSAIPHIASEYDEPFGNNSAVPTYFCAKAAREAGFERMLAGDGGDEIFGGNARYAKQKLFEAYFHIPEALRRGLIEPVASFPVLGNHFPLRKLRRYIEQANVRLPMRLEAYNFMHRNPLDDIFEPDFLGTIDVTSTDAALAEVYERTSSDHYINRMMHVDLKFTLADNDLRKVSTMTEAAGIEVHYPLLDDRLVAFANCLPIDYKVRGHKLRWFFKEALRDLLPEKIINKSKHGFGLPFGVWSAQHAPLSDLVGDSLSDLGKRGWVKPAYLEEMLRMQRGEHASYYGVMIWVTMMLEQWLQANEH
ncbi:MAG: asparagine synthase-related protein [Thiobacillaceae bacterium]